MELYDCALIMSGLLNVMAFCYALLLMITKSICRKYDEKAAPCMEMVNIKHITSFGYIISKAVINILSCFLILGMGLYIIITSDVCLNPLFAHDDSIMFSISLLLAVCGFNMVLVALTETLTSRNLPEIFVSMVMSLVSIVILVRKEDAVMGVICLFMFGSVLSDELLNVRAIPLDLTKKRSNGWVHQFRLCMHLLCNFTLPLVLYFVPTWFSKQKLFEMENSSIIVFFFAVTLLVFCNVWRLKDVLNNLCMRVKKENTADDIFQTDAWHPNDKRIVKFIHYADKGLVFKTSNDYVIGDDLLKVADFSKINMEASCNIVNKPHQVKLHEKQTVDTEYFEDIDINVTF